MAPVLPVAILCLLASCSSSGVHRVTSAEVAPEVSVPGVGCSNGAGRFAPEPCAGRGMTCATGDDCFAREVCGEGLVEAFEEICSEICTENCIDS